jgi:23S rRNA pseudouridine1911/1915/1917 synthase
MSDDDRITSLRADQVGVRLDTWLAARLPEQSRTAIQTLIKAGQVKVNGHPQKSSYRLEADDLITLEVPATPTDAGLVAQAIPLKVLHEDDDILVIAKPPGLVVHPAAGHEDGTLVNAILHHVPDLLSIGGERRPGIVHRLDKDTSGVMVVAKHDRALRELQSQFRGRTVTKHYLALLEGRINPVNGHISAPLGRHPVDRKRQAVLTQADIDAGRARTAETEYETVAQYSVPLLTGEGRGTFVLVRAKLMTGRTHQLRVHFAWCGHPIVGDPIYGLRRQRLASPRLFLHAQTLGFRAPSGEWLQFVEPLPDDLQSVLDRLGRQSE